MRSTRPVGDDRLPARQRLRLATLLLTLLPACAASLPSAAPPLSSQPPAAGVTAPPNRILFRGKPLYLSGFNIAWFDFASDVGKGIDEARLRQAASDLAKAGGNTLRWWIHTDGSRTPEWGEVHGERRVLGPGATFIVDLRRALDIVAEYDVHIVLCLWSFDMLRDNDHRHPPVRDNYRLLTEDAVLDSYIDHALVPMVSALNDHPALLAWELFNEPENMTEDWFKRDKAFYGGPVPSLAQLQRVQAKMAAAIHRAANTGQHLALVTTGSKSIGKYNSDVAGGINLYRDDRLQAAADGDPLARLDFYEPHYYDNEGDHGAWSVFHHRAAYWQVDKPIVVGEFHTLGSLDLLGEPIAAAQMCQRLVDYGYAGGWPWQWNEHPEQLKACLRAVTVAGGSTRLGEVVAGR
ncbi:MAG: putative retaining b-glycosidase [Pseudomonadota bacterium]